MRGWKGNKDAGEAAAAAKEEGFAAGTIIFSGHRGKAVASPATYHAYLRAWMDELKACELYSWRLLLRYSCEGRPGVSITTPDDISSHAPSHES